MEIGVKIRAYRESLGLSRADFAAKLNEKPSKIQDVETGKQRISDIFLINLADIFPIDIGDLFRKGSSRRHVNAAQKAETPSKNKEDFISIPRFEVSASAGDGSLVEGEPKEGYCAFSATWLQWRNLKPDQLSVISVVGDSMEPELFDNDLILLDRAFKDPRRGGLYVVHYAGELYVKRIQVLPGDWVRLLSSNTFYDPIEVEPTKAYDFSLIGRVVATMHEW